MLANLLSAAASGGILVKGMELSSSIPGIFGDSILSYLLGSVVSFFILTKLRSLNRKWTPVFSVLSCVISLLMLLLLSGKLFGKFIGPLFVILMSFQFAASFVPRSYRIEMSAGKGSLLSWVEFSNAFGYFICLLFFQRHPEFSLAHSIELAIVLTAITAALDFIVFFDWDSKCESADTTSGQNNLAAKAQFNAEFYRVLLVLVFLTLSIQVVVQILSKTFQTADLLAAFDLGTSVAPVCCGLLSLILTGGLSGFFKISKKKVRYLWLCMITLANMAFSVFFLAYLGGSNLIVFACVVISSFCYEILALLLIDWAGTGVIPRSQISIIYGAMGIAATGTYAAFLLIGNGVVFSFVLISIAFALARIGRINPNCAFDTSPNCP